MVDQDGQWGIRGKEGAQQGSGRRGGTKGAWWEEKGRAGGGKCCIGMRDKESEEGLGFDSVRRGVGRVGKCVVCVCLLMTQGTPAS